MRDLGFFVIAALISAGAWAQGTVVYKNAGSAVYDDIGTAIQREAGRQGLSVSEGAVDVAADPGRAKADLEDMVGRNIRYVYAVGGGAVALATSVARFGGVYVYVPNPYPTGLAYKSRWLGVSPYPEPSAVFRYVRDTMGLERVALLYTKKNNQEIAKEFEKASGGAGLSCILVGLDDSAELAGKLEGALPGVDAVVLLLDPLAFNANSLRFIVTKCMENRKPTIGFKDDAAAAGVTVALFPTADQIGKRAAEAMRTLVEKGEDRMVLYPPDFAAAVNDAALGALGLRFDQSKVVKHY